MKNLEVVLLDTKTKKLTITPTRITIKLPTTTPNEEVEAYKTLALAIYEDIKPEQSWRGKFRPNGIMMNTERKKEQKFFKIEEPC